MTTKKFIREPECQQITGLSRSTRWRLEREGKFPARHYISQNTIGWLASEIDQWIESRTSHAVDTTKSKAISAMTNKRKNPVNGGADARI